MSADLSKIFRYPAKTAALGRNLPGPKTQKPGSERPGIRKAISPEELESARPLVTSHRPIARRPQKRTRLRSRKAMAAGRTYRRATRERKFSARPNPPSPRATAVFEGTCFTAGAAAGSAEAGSPVTRQRPKPEQAPERRPVYSALPPDRRP